MKKLAFGLTFAALVSTAAHADSFDASPYETAAFAPQSFTAATQRFTPRASYRAATETSTPIQASAWFRPSDRGGRVGDYVAQIVAAAGQRHEIRGDCMSACTMWLGHRNTCVAPDAVLHFHGAVDRQANYTPAPWRQVSNAGNATLLAFYPARVRAVVRPWLQSTNFRTLTGTQLASLGVPSCG